MILKTNIMKFNWRNLFLLTNQFFKNRGEFNAFLFLIDLLTWVVVFVVIIAYIFR